MGQKGNMQPVPRSKCSLRIHAPCRSLGASQTQQSPKASSATLETHKGLSHLYTRTSAVVLRAARWDILEECPCVASGSTSD